MSAQITITTITRNAGADDLSDSDYRDIYDEIRQLDPVTGRYAVSLDKFVEMIGSAYSKALWSKYHNGQADPNRVMRSELRASVGLAPLPPTVVDAAAAHLDANAEVVAIGDGPGHRCLIIAEAQPLLIGVNGTITAMAAATPNHDDVTGVTRQRKPYWRPCLPPELREMVESSGKSIEELVQIALEK